MRRPAGLAAVCCHWLQQLLIKGAWLRPAGNCRSADTWLPCQWQVVCLSSSHIVLSAAEAESACYISVNETLTDADVCPPQGDGSLQLSPTSTCCQALAGGDCWDSLATRDEAPVWTVGGKNYSV